MVKFIREYESRGYWDVYWGVSSSLTCDKLELLDDFVKIPEKEKILRKENTKQSVVNF